MKRILSSETENMLVEDAGQDKSSDIRCFLGKDQPTG